jgi:hypothetical protein
MRRAALSLLVAACSFDATGQTGASGGGAGVGMTTGTGAVTTTGEPGTSGGSGATSGGVGMSGTTAAIDPTTGADSSTGPATTTPPPVTTGGETTTSDETTMAPDPSTTTGTGDETTSGGDGCPGPVKILELVADADLDFPMEFEVSGSGEGTIATSGYSDVGTVEFTVDIPCAGEYAVWARVYDGNPGVHDYADPDSYYVRVDGGAEFTWFYGCQTEDANQAWNWLRTRGVGDDCGDFDDWTLPLAPGPHVIRFRNRESQTNGGTRAAIARILVTDDPGYVPTVE